MNGTEFRMDANLPAGTRSWAVDDGIVTEKSEAGEINSTAIKGPVPSTMLTLFRPPCFREVSHFLIGN
jgi:hypothetical protein